MRRSGPKPLCACGCHVPVKRWNCRYASPACVPTSVRSAGATKGRQSFAYRRRAILFRAELERLTMDGRRITRESLCDVFEAVYDRGWQNGYHSADWKHRRRQEKAA